MKVLIVSPYRGIGDLIFHLPLFRYLNSKFNIKINLIVNENTKAKFILKQENIISKIIYGDFNRQNQIRKIINLRNKINKFNPDLTILTAPSKRLKASLIISNSKKNIYFRKSSQADLAKYIYNETKNNFKISTLNRNYKLNISGKNKKCKKKNIFLSIDSHHNQNNWGEENYIELVSKLLSKNLILFINFSPKNKKKFSKILKKFKNNSNVSFTYKKKIFQILKIITNSNYIIGNESGPICIGASLNRKVLSIYNPKTTPQSSKTINNNVVYLNSQNLHNNKIIKKIIKFVSLK